MWFHRDSESTREVVRNGLGGRDARAERGARIDPPMFTESLGSVSVNCRCGFRKKLGKEGVCDWIRYEKQQNSF